MQGFRSIPLGISMVWGTALRIVNARCRSRPRPHGSIDVSFLLSELCHGVGHGLVTESSVIGGWNSVSSHEIYQAAPSFTHGCLEIDMLAQLTILFWSIILIISQIVIFVD